MRVGLWRNLGAEELMLLKCSVGEDSWESLGLQGDPTSTFRRRAVLGVLRKEWCWSWNSSTLATSCEELTHWKRLWCLEGLGAGGEGDDRGWDGWMASLTRWTWVWVNSGRWWWTGRPESEVAQSCPALCNPLDCSLPGSSVHWILQARILEWVAISFSRGSSQPRNRSWVSRNTGRFFTIWATRHLRLQQNVTQADVSSV